jgi:hypothetical protein
MLQYNYGNYKYLGLLAALSITFALASNFVTARLVPFFGVPVSVSIYTFPVVYLISDILTEVYGYAYARSILWLTVICRVLAGIMVWLMLQIPAAPIFHDEAAYQTVLSTGLRMAVAALIAVFAGDICNSYILAKMKIWMGGRRLWARFVVSTFFGEGVNTLVFYFMAFYGVLELTTLLTAIVAGTLAKTAWEIIALPLTYPVVRRLKSIEKVDYYDRNTDFNPFITTVKSR